MRPLHQEKNRPISPIAGTSAIHTINGTVTMKAASMKMVTSAFFVTLMLVLLGVPGATLAATPYGEAVVEKGRITVMRDGKNMRFRKSATPITIQEGDLIRVRRKSQVLLKSREKATITLGANAVFHVQAWKAKEKSGFARMLFGRVRASITGLTGGERFNVKTATATIGVKGTGYRSAVNPRGDAMLITTENVVQFGGPTGGDQDVGINNISVVVNGRAASAPVLTPDVVAQVFSDDNLDSPPANSDAARGLPAEKELVEAGIIDQDDADEGKKDTGESDGTDIDDIDLDVDVNSALDNLNRARVRIAF